MTRVGGHDRPRSWEPMDAGDLVGLRLLADAAPRTEGDALARLEAVAVDDLGELVVWAWVLDADRTHVLMIDHHRWGVWMAPGGRVERGEDPLEAAARELFEETGAIGAPDTTTPALVDAIESVDPDGRPVTTFGIAFAFHADRRKALSPEAGQPGPLVAARRATRASQPAPVAVDVRAPHPYEVKSEPTTLTGAVACQPARPLTFPCKIVDVSLQERTDASVQNHILLSSSVSTSFTRCQHSPEPGLA